MRGINGEGWTLDLGGGGVNTVQWTEMCCGIGNLKIVWLC